MKSPLEAQVLIIGGGATGTGIARDLALRGVQCILAEHRDINAGASGANHGLLHSGARYVSNDPPAARGCMLEGDLLKGLAPHCIENTGGLFVAIEGDDENYVADFPNLCTRCGIPVRAVDIQEALEREPALSDRLIAAYEVEDATIDPFRLSMENIAQAKGLGSVVLPHIKVIGFNIKGRCIVSAVLRNKLTGEEILVIADQFLNAAGAWAGEVASLAGATIDMIYSKGSLLVTHRRITRRVVNRLRPPSDADILVPGGTVSILGTTSVQIPCLDSEHIRPTVEETDLIVSEGALMIPELETARYIRAYAGVRPLLDLHTEEDDRSLSRGFYLFDHEQDKLKNFATITGGKLTTYRLMAEKAANLVCERLGNTKPCLTGGSPLPSTDSARWTEPGMSPRLWLEGHDTDDVLLCECEMVPKSAVNEIVAEISMQNGKPGIQAIGLRSRLGKGPCQGTFCSVRITAHMYQQGAMVGQEGLSHLREFLCARWKGQKAILWDGQLIQAELMEALHCGLFSLELTA